LVGKPEEKKPFQRPGVERRIILKWTLKKEDGKARTRFIWLRIETSGGLL
jgi:hypothetical protein